MGGNGYISINDINLDQSEEYQRIVAQNNPNPPYTFVLCEGVTFDANLDGPLIPLLSGAVYTCGPNVMSRPTNGECIITRGAQQILIEDATFIRYSLDNVDFNGITFEEFSGVSIAAQASSTTTATFHRCTWRNFNSDFVVRVNFPATRGITANRVEIVDSIIIDGNGGSLFSNENGELYMDQISISNLTGAGSFLSTSNSGVSFIENSVLTESSFDTVISVTNQATQSLRGVEIYRMVDMLDTFKVNNGVLLANRTDVYDNVITRPWTLINLENTGTAVFEYGQFLSNEGSLNLFTSGENSVLNLTESYVTGNAGVAASGVSNLVYAIEGTINLFRTRFENNQKWTAQLFAIFAGELRTEETCFYSGSGTLFAFISNDSGFTIENNYLDQRGVSSQICTDANVGRVFAEGPDSTCFQNDNCNIDPDRCFPFATALNCLPDLTVAPSVSPTISSVPSIDPTGKFDTPDPTASPTDSPTLPFEFDESIFPSGITITQIPTPRFANWLDSDWSDLPENIQAAAEILGYDEDKWNNDLPTSTDGMLWEELTSEQQNAATAIGYNKDTWDEEMDGIMSIDDWQNTDWSDLPDKIRTAADTLGYDEESWNKDLSVYTDNFSWEELSDEQVNAASTLGYTEATWDGGIGTDTFDITDWMEYKWSELPQRIQAAAGMLGYNEDRWDSNSRVYTDMLEWVELTGPQQNAALVLGYREETWPGGKHRDPLTITDWQNYKWSELPQNIQDAATILGYDENRWDNDLPVYTDELFWNELSNDQQMAASVLGYTEETWKGKANICDDIWECEAYEWSELPESIQIAAAILGYDENRWNNDLPVYTDDLSWDELSEVQKGAAIALGYNEKTWDFGFDPTTGFGAYSTYDWSDLPEAIKIAAAILGYDEHLWNNDLPVYTDTFSWSELTTEQQYAASQFGFTEETWNDRNDRDYDDYYEDTDCSTKSKKSRRHKYSDSSSGIVSSTKSKSDDSSKGNAKGKGKGKEKGKVKSYISDKSSKGNGRKDKKKKGCKTKSSQATKRKTKKSYMKKHTHSSSRQHTTTTTTKSETKTAAGKQKKKIKQKRRWRRKRQRQRNRNRKRHLQRDVPIPRKQTTWLISEEKELYSSLVSPINLEDNDKKMLRARK